MPGFARIAFTDAVKALQAKVGSRASYARMEARDDGTGRLDEEAAAFIESRDSFYLATVNADGWPYIQHRGGPKGFVRVLDEKHIAFLDFAGNRQFVSVGNIESNDRVALFLMDYPSKSRLKLLGRTRIVPPEAFDERLEALRPPEGYPGKVERAFVIEVAGWDWNCPQHITQRYTLDELREMAQP
jgi:predicted pyridoxine 5'-phosphate oxidase superfamily flavin-nucleotide-binding protein